ncbi:hypothetical protein HUN61_02130 [Neoehrlichia mikurensis]|nr:hypothetical protein [Neoehrlichia mikurensis]QXK92781.1 hypothetical protein HUN61_02130 [Neoehrlichia mikurensis]
MLLSYILSNMKGIFSKIIFLIIFSYLVSATLIIFTEGISEIFMYRNPKNVYIYSFNYFKWYYYNLDSLTYGRVFKIGFAFIVPYFIQITIWNIKWKDFLLHIFGSIFLRKDYSNKDNLCYDYGYTGNANDIYFIKNSFMKNIDSLINNIIYEVLNTKNKTSSNSCNIDINFIKNSNMRKIESLVDNIVYEMLIFNKKIHNIEDNDK